MVISYPVIACFACCRFYIDKVKKGVGEYEVTTYRGKRNINCSRIMGKQCSQYHYIQVDAFQGEPYRGSREMNSAVCIFIENGSLLV